MPSGKRTCRYVGSAERRPILIPTALEIIASLTFGLGAICVVFNLLATILFLLNRLGVNGALCALTFVVLGLGLCLWAGSYACFWALRTIWAKRALRGGYGDEQSKGC